MSMICNKYIVPALLAGKAPIEGRRCVAWDDDENWFVSGVFLGRDELARKYPMKVRTDHEGNEVFHYMHAVLCEESDEQM